MRLTMDECQREHFSVGGSLNGHTELAQVCTQNSSSTISLMW